MKRKIVFVIAIIIMIGGGVRLAIYNKSGVLLNTAYDKDSNNIDYVYNKSGDIVFPILPIPTGNLIAMEEIPLPSIYGDGKGWTCTGLAKDGDTFLVGDIGIQQPGGTTKSQIVRVNIDFDTVIETIPLYTAFQNLGDVQGITVDTSDDTLWFCAPSSNSIKHITKAGVSIENISMTSPTGVAYDPSDDTLWVLNYSNKIIHMHKNGTVISTDDFAYSDTLDQCFLDAERGYLYITAGANYSSRNNIYLFNTKTDEQSITCTVDSYSVEGLWIGADKMIIVNDGYYHSAYVPVNQANVYDLS